MTGCSEKIHKEIMTNFPLEFNYYKGKGNVMFPCGSNDTVIKKGDRLYDHLYKLMLNTRSGWSQIYYTPGFVDGNHFYSKIMNISIDDDGFIQINIGNKGIVQGHITEEQVKQLFQ